MRRGRLELLRKDVFNISIDSGYEHQRKHIWKQIWVSESGIRSHGSHAIGAIRNLGPWDLIRNTQTSTVGCQQIQLDKNICFVTLHFRKVQYDVLQSQTIDIKTCCWHFSLKLWLNKKNWRSRLWQNLVARYITSAFTQDEGGTPSSRGLYITHSLS